MSPSLISKEVTYSSPVSPRKKATIPRNVTLERNKPVVSTDSVIVSMRPHVGQPDYSLHPVFIQPGSFAVLPDTSTLT